MDDTGKISKDSMEFQQQTNMIVIRCQSGEKAAFEELFEIYQPRLKYYLRRLDSDGTNVEDVLQDIWLTVFRKIHTLKQGQSVGVWLYRIARNKVYDGFRRKDRFVSLPEEEIPVSGTDEPVFDGRDVEELHRALNRLKPHHREVLTLCFVEQMPYESIAHVIDCTVGTVRSRIFYAKQALRREMEGQNG
jgi:RNA polymerase sigma-70 factor (ECF subfamily)